MKLVVKISCEITPKANRKERNVKKNKEKFGKKKDVSLWIEEIKKISYTTTLCFRIVHV